MPSERSQSKKYPTTVAEDATNKGFPAYRDTPTDDNSATPKQSTASKHRSGTEGHTNSNRMVYHNRWDPQGHQTKTKGDQPINTTTDSQHHQECKDQEGNQPEGTRAIDEASNIRGIKKISGIKDSQDAKSSKITFNLEDGDNASTDNITMRLAQTRFRTYREHEQLGQPASNATLKWDPQQTMDAEDQCDFLAHKSFRSSTQA